MLVYGELAPATGDHGPVMLVASRSSPNPLLDQLNTKFGVTASWKERVGGGGPARTVMPPEPLETEDPLWSGQAAGK